MGMLSDPANIKSTDGKNKLVYLGDNMDNKSDRDLQKLGLQDASNAMGDGWYTLKLLERGEEPPQTSEQLMKEVNKLILENGELSSHLEKANTLFNIHKEMEDDRSEKKRIEVEILDEKIKKKSEVVKGLELVMKQKVNAGDLDFRNEDILYDHNDDVFSKSVVLNENTRDESNYLDIYIGETFFDRSVINELLLKIDISPNNFPKVVFVVEFYNLETLTSQVYQDQKFDAQFQASFAFKAEKDFFMYAMSRGFKIEAYGMIENSRILLGTCNFSLQKILRQNASLSDKNMSLCAIIKEVEVLHSRTVARSVGNISITYRIRKPCGMQAKLYINNINVQSSVNGNAENDVRNLVVKIIKGSGFNKHSNTFVSYTLMDESTHFTNSIVGMQPQYDYIKTHEVMYNDVLKDQLQTFQMEFIVFDESKSITSGNDMIGYANISLKDLIIKGRNAFIDQLVKVQNPETGTSGFVEIKIYFKDLKNEDFYDDLKTNQRQNYDRNLLRENDDSNLDNHNSTRANQLISALVKIIKDRELDLKAAYNIFDKNNNKTVTEQEFFKGLTLFWQNIDVDDRSILWEELRIGTTENYITWREFNAKMGMAFNKA